MSFMFWQGIKSLRSVAYFKEAMDAGGTESLQQKWKDNPRWRDRLILSGVICASTVALLGRSVYRKVKGNIKKNKKKKEREQKKLDNDFVNNYSLSKPMTNESDNNKPKVIEPQVEDNGDVIIRPSKQDINTDNYYNKPTEIDDIDQMFEEDAMPTQEMYHMGGKIKHMRYVTTAIDRPNCVLVVDNDDDKKYYINGSGIFDKDHNSYFIAGQNETLALSRLIQHKSKAIIGDLFTIFESYDDVY